MAGLVVGRRREDEVPDEIPEGVGGGGGLFEIEFPGTVGGAGGETVTHGGQAAPHLRNK